MTWKDWTIWVVLALSLAVMLLMASGVVQAGEGESPKPGSEIAVTETDRLRWENLGLKAEILRLKAQTEQRQLQAEWQQLDQEWKGRYRVGLEQVRRDGSRWIVQDAPPSSVTPPPPTKGP